MLNRKPSDLYLVTKYNDPDDDQEISVFEHPSYDSAKQLSSFQFIYKKSNKVVSEERFSLRNYFPLEMDTMLRNCGFEILHKYGSFKYDSFSNQSMKQIFICKVLR